MLMVPDLEREQLVNSIQPSFFAQAIFPDEKIFP
jgi:hypothetical protein